MSIEELIRSAAADGRVISLGGALPAPELFPRKELTDAFQRAMREPACHALQYDWPEGQGRLRRWVAERLQHRGAAVTEEDVIITAGAQQALALTVQLLLRPGARIETEPETYSSALDLFRRRGLSIVPPGAQGDLVYLVDGITNPHGRSPDPGYRDGSARSDRPLLVDEAYAELAFGGELPQLLLGESRERVWHVGTLSKTLSPGLRVGWLVPPRAMRSRVIDLKQATDLQTATLGQCVAENFLERDDFDARLARTRAFYARRAEALVGELRRRLPSWRFREPQGGFSLFVETDREGEEPPWLRTALAHGVSFDPGSSFCTDRGPRPLTMRLCFCACAPSRLAEGVRRLARAWSAHARASAPSSRAVDPANRSRIDPTA